MIHSEYPIGRINGCSRRVVATFFAQHTFIVLIEFAGLLNAMTKKIFLSHCILQALTNSMSSSKRRYHASLLDGILRMDKQMFGLSASW